MAIDPVSIFLLGTCLVACWPCLLPCCLAIPIIPFPLLIVESGRMNMERNKKVSDAKYCYVYVTESGILLRKNKPNFDHEKATT